MPSLECLHNTRCSSWCLSWSSQSPDHSQWHLLDLPQVFSPASTFHHHHCHQQQPAANQHTAQSQCPHHASPACKAWTVEAAGSHTFTAMSHPGGPACHRQGIKNSDSQNKLSLQLWDARCKHSPPLLALPTSRVLQRGVSGDIGSLQQRGTPEATP